MNIVLIPISDIDVVKFYYSANKSSSIELPQDTIE